eukprot:jgi/Mesvir1/17131/Mv07562-RA.1
MHASAGYILAPVAAAGAVRHSPKRLLPPRLRQCTTEPVGALGRARRLRRPWHIARPGRSAAVPFTVVSETRVYNFNFNEYIVTLEKPLGVHFALEGHEVYVKSLTPRGNAEACRLISLGDSLKKTSAVFGDMMWDADDFGKVMYAIKTRQGPITMLFERKPTPLGAKNQAPSTASAPDATTSLTGEASSKGASSSIAGNLAREGTEAGSAGLAADGRNSEGGVGRVEDTAGIGEHAASAATSFAAKSAVSPDAPTTRLVRALDQGQRARDVGLHLVEEYNEAMRRALMDLEYHHRQGMELTRVTPRLLIGDCPQSREDILLLKHQLGVTAVLSLQPPSDLAHLGIDAQAITSFAKQANLLLLHDPIRDFDPGDLRQRLPGVTAVMRRLLQAGHNVYVHCTNGVGRSPAAAVAYLHWHNGMSLQDAHRLVTSKRRCAPNREAIAYASFDLISFADMGGEAPVFPMQIVWQRGGKQVLLAGDFLDGWDVPTRVPYVGNGVHMLEMELQAGTYHFKFIVDGRWQYSPDLPVDTDSNGNVNNVVVVHGTQGQNMLEERLPVEVMEAVMPPEQRRKLSYVAACMAFRISPKTFAPKRRRRAVATRGSSAR